MLKIKWAVTGLGIDKFTSENTKVWYYNCLYFLYLQGIVCVVKKIGWPDQWASSWCFFKERWTRTLSLARKQKRREKNKYTVAPNPSKCHIKLEMIRYIFFSHASFTLWFLSHCLKWFYAVDVLGNSLPILPLQYIS